MRRISILIMALLTVVAVVPWGCSSAEAAGIRVVGPAAPIAPGDDFHVDIVVEGIPAEGLGGIQFRLNVTAVGGNVVGVSDLSQADEGAVSIVSPLLESPPTATRSGIGDFFWNATGSNGILFIDNEQLVNGSALFTYAHTNGAVLPSGAGSVARFRGHVGEGVKAQRVDLFLTQVMLMDGGTWYPQEYNEGASLQVLCMTRMPALLGLTRAEAEAALSGANLILGSVYELENSQGNHGHNVVLEHSFPTGSDIACMTPVDIAINIPPMVGVDQPMYVTNSPSQTITGTMEAGAQVRVAAAPAFVGTVFYPSATTWAVTISELPEGVTPMRISAADAVGNTATVSTEVAYVKAGQALLQVTVGGTGSGTVNISPAEMACNANCSATFTAGETIVLRAVPSQYSLFAGWSNGSCAGTGDCVMSLDTDASVTATFNRDTVHQVRLDGTQTFFPALQAAYDAVSTGSVIKVWGIDFNEHIVCNQSKAVTFQGNYNQDYTLRTGRTVIHGSISVVRGSVVIDALTIQ